MVARSVIIAGAASAIGSACARRFIEAGDRLVLADSDEEALRELGEDLKAKGEAVFVAGDLSNRLHVHNVVAEALETYGRVDAFANATVEVDSGEFLELTEDALDAQLRMNLKSAFLITQAVCRQLVRQIEASTESQSQGALVNILSVEAVTAAADRAGFAMAQGALHQLTKAAALAMAPHGVRINAVGIGAIKADYMKDFDVKSAKSTVPLNRLGDPEDVAEAAYFLTSPAAAYITGQTLFVDGGRIVRSGAAGYAEKGG